MPQNPGEDNHDALELHCENDRFLGDIAEDLRTRDTIIGLINQAVADGVLTQDEALLSLAHEYEGYFELERRFDDLLHGGDDRPEFIRAAL